MIITHTSLQEITRIDSYYNECLRGCLFFGEEGNDYCLGYGDHIHYDMEVEKVLDITLLKYKHDEEEYAAFIEEALQEEALFEAMDAEELLSYITEEDDYVGEAETAWLIQQYQGIIAHKLGYDCAESTDEQGVVYIAYMVNNEDKLKLV